jgi:hypothetical protein
VTVSLSLLDVALTSRLLAELRSSSCRLPPLPSSSKSVLTVMVSPPPTTMRY